MSAIMKAAGGTAEILIYEDIGSGWLGGISAKQFAEELKALGKISTINVRLNSEGGNVFDGVAIFNTLRRHQARVVVDIDGMALSIASLVAMAGDEIRMADNALMMVHDPWIVMAGTADELRKQAELMDQVKENLVGTYADRTKLKPEKVSALLSEETWMDSKQARELGFVDAVTEERRIAAKFDPDKFKHVPEFAMKRWEEATPRLDLYREKVQHNALKLKAGT